MKKIGYIFVLFFTILGFPAVIQTYLNTFYTTYKNCILIAFFLVAIVFIIAELNVKISPSVNKILRNIKFFFLRTKVVAFILVIQLLIIAFFILNDNNSYNLNGTIISLIINLIALNLLIITGKISSTDSSQLVLHEESTGKMYLYHFNKIRHIPDPPTFDLLGLNWSDAVDVTSQEIQSYNLLPKITSLKDMKLIKYRGRVYGIVNEELRHIPNESTLAFILNHRDSKQIEEVNEIQGFSIGKSFTKI